MWKYVNKHILQNRIMWTHITEKLNCQGLTKTTAVFLPAYEEVY